MPEQVQDELCVSCGTATVEVRSQMRPENSFCLSCYTDHFSACEDCGCELDREQDAIRERNGIDYCDICFHDRFMSCCDCGDEIERDSAHLLPGGDYVCDLCFSNNFSRCERCGELTDIDNINGGCCQECGCPSEWADGGFYEPDTSYDEIRSQRKFGVEIETSACPNHTEIREHTCFGCKEDGSVDGMEFVSPVLYGDAGLHAVENICSLARERNFEVDSACGMHVHFDMSSEPDEHCFKVALAYHYTYDLWMRFVSDARMSNYYCAKHEYEHHDCINYRTFRDFVRNATYNERYRWINWESYNRHGTVETRIHSATLNATKINNWIKANSRFIDGVINMSMAEITRAFAGRSVYDMFEVFSELWADDDLTSFYKSRAERFHKPIVKENLVSV